MNKQINPDHCYETEDGVLYMLESAFKVDGTRDSPEWHVLKNGRKHRTFTSLMAAKCWLEHVASTETGEELDLDESYGARADYLYERDR